VTDVADLADLVAGPRVAVAERGGAPVTGECDTVLVGPEGGWAVEEVPGHVPRVRLADHVLRAETAAITAGVLLREAVR
jgi:16S rRNA U1498 N3-methylase RsmE